MFISIILTFFCCTTSDNETEINSPNCYHNTPYYFEGIVNGEVKCLTEGSDNFQKYIGAILTSNGGSEYYKRYIFGMDTFPVSEGDNFVLMHSPKLISDSIEEIKSVFPIKVLDKEDRSDFQLWYGKVEKTRDSFPTSTKILKAKFDDHDASIAIFEFREIEYYSNIGFIVSLKFNCNLYNSNGIKEARLENGVLTGLVLPNSN